MDKILQTNGLTKCYYGSKNVVDQVSMTINKGDIYGFIGKNGAGKTTFMKMICGLTKPTSGEISLFGSGELQEGRRKIGCAIEYPAIWPNMTAKQNLNYFSILLGIKDESYIDYLLQLVGLNDVGKKKAGKFSLGMKQRLAIAISMIEKPEFLVLDEPINGLDPAGIVEVRELLLRLNQEKKITILIASHILGELSKLVTKYGVIVDGKLVQEFEAEQLKDKLTQCIQITVDDIGTAEQLLKEQVNNAQYQIVDQNKMEIFNQEIDPAKINRIFVEHGINVSRLDVDGQDMESYLVNMMGGN